MTYADQIPKAMKASWNEEMIQTLNSEIVKMYTNMAVCSLKANDWLSVKEDLLKALAKDTKNTKGNIILWFV